MSKLFNLTLLAGQLSLLSSVAFAEPAYVGPRYANAEAETFGSVWATPQRALVFQGTAGLIGAESGDPEKDTVAFRTVVSVAEAQPALGAEGGRELQGLVILLVQPADGARAARELQSFELPLMAQLSEECR
jgi:hypothetical protein